MNLNFLLDRYKTIFNKCGYKKPTSVYAMYEMGKTTAAIHYCSVKPNCIYFPFSNMEADFALKAFCNNNPDIMGICLGWCDFFETLENLAKEKRLTVFFDDVGVRNDKDNFYEELNLFLNKNTKTAIIFLCNSWDKVDIDCDDIIVDCISIKEIADHFELTEKEAANIYLLTGGIASILSEYDINLTFDGNVKTFVNNKSAFYNYILKCMQKCFRSPETYNTLLYAISNGYNRISEISAFSGQPKNKCDKYIKSLIEYGFVRKEVGKNGYTRYYPAHSFFSLWYNVLFMSIPHADGTFHNRICDRCVKYFYENIIPDFYKNLCINWIKINFSTWLLINKEEEFAKQSNIVIDGINFGLVFKDKGKKYYFYYNTLFGEGLTKSLVETVEKITTKENPFYDNEYFYLSVNRIPDSLDKLPQKYDNIHFVRLGALFTAYNTKKIKKRY